MMNLQKFDAILLSSFYMIQDKKLLFKFNL